MYIPTFDGVPTVGVGLMGASTPVVGKASGSGGSSGGGPAIDVDYGDMKMAARLDDHAEGAVQWMLCDGRAINRVTYAQLFAVVGVTFGIGDGATTFNIPLLTNSLVPGAPQGRFPIGVSALGYALGQQMGTARHIHNLAGLIGGLLAHAYNPNGVVTGMTATPRTLAAGVPVIDGNDSHVVPAPTHDPASGPWNSDIPAADIQNPYVAVGFFMRVL